MEVPLVALAALAGVEVLYYSSCSGGVTRAVAGAQAAQAGQAEQAGLDVFRRRRGPP